jgi:hypothetical protein
MQSEGSDPHYPREAQDDPCARVSREVIHKFQVVTTQTPCPNLA